MGVYDQASRYAAKINPPGFVRWLSEKYAQSWIFEECVDTSTIPFPGEPDRICDTVGQFRRAVGEPDMGTDGARRRLLDIELQSEPHGDMIERLGEYGFRLRREVRHGGGQSGKYDVSSVVLNLTGAPQDDLLDMQCEELDQAGFVARVKVITMREVSAAETLNRIEADPELRCMLPWIPLMQGADQSDIIERWKTLADQEPNPQWKADYGGLALVFSELSQRGPIWKKALEGWNVQESPQVLEWQREARAEGKKEYLKLAVRSRFGPGADDQLLSTIDNLQDSDKMNRLFEAVLGNISLEDFHKLLNGAESTK